MTEHKFTDEKIIRVLECCADCDCYNAMAKEYCPFVSIPFCKNYMRKQALDLINRQREEIAVIKETTAEIRYEAIKEFAKHLIDKSKNGCILASDLPDIVIDFLRNKRGANPNGNQEDSRHNILD